MVEKKLYDNEGRRVCCIEGSVQSIGPGEENTGLKIILVTFPDNGKGEVESSRSFFLRGLPLDKDVELLGQKLRIYTNEPWNRTAEAVHGFQVLNGSKPKNYILSKGYEFR